VLVPYHVSRDCRARWEHGRHIKCPGLRTHNRRREALLCSRPIGLLEPLPYSMVTAHRAPIGSRDPISVFEATVDIEPWRLCVDIRASSWNLDLLILLVRVMVRVPAIGILDSSPRVSA